MDRDQFDSYCRTLTSSSHVVQWGNASVWKVGGKIFAICPTWGEGGHDKFSFKCSDLSYRILWEQPGIIPAPYLARAKWVSVQEPGAMSDDDLKAYIKEAHAIIARKLPKKLQRDLGLLSSE
jgi:predicted DNA-binding protein (MmcQ/YjbR family)